MVELGLTVETVGVAHCHALAELHATGFTPGWTAAEIAGLLTMPGTIGLIACDNGRQPVGMLLCRHAAGEAEVLTIAVVAGSRRAGAGMALLSAAFAALPAPVGEVFVEVAEANLAARYLYGRAGFDIVGRRAGYYRTCAGAEDAIVMRRALP